MKNNIQKECQSQILKKNIEIYRLKGQQWDFPLSQMIKAAYEFSRVTYRQELEREKRISSSMNVNLVISGFLVTALITAFVNNTSCICKWLLLSSLLVLGINLLLLLFSFSYRKRYQMNSPCKIANNILEDHIKDETLDDFNREKDVVNEGNFIFSIEPSYNDLSRQNDISIILLRISNVISAIVIITFVIALFFYK